MTIRKYTASQLRGDIYRVLDRVLETGTPVEVERNGRIVRIIAGEPPSKMARLVVRPVIKGDLESIVHLDWSSHWKPAL